MIRSLNPKCTQHAREGYVVETREGESFSMGREVKPGRPRWDALIGGRAGDTVEAVLPRGTVVYQMKSGERW